MRKLLIILCFLPQFSFAQDTLYLFNGKNLEGWYAFEPDTGKISDDSRLFVVADSTIRLYGEKAGYLMTQNSFGNFILTLEYRWNTDTLFARKNNSKNSGVIYFVPDSSRDMLWPMGIQFQIKENATGDFILLQNFTLEVNDDRNEPGKSVVIKRIADSEKPFGEWNTITITSIAGEIKQELNGVLVNQGKNPSVSEGRILLQYEGFPIDFRNIILVIPAEKKV